MSTWPGSGHFLTPKCLLEMLTPMTSESDAPTGPSAGGFVGGARKEAADRIIATRQAALNELPIKLAEPSEAEHEEGGVARFALGQEGVTISGLVSRGEAGLTITRVEVSAPLPGGVTQRLLRDTPLAGILKAARALAAWENAQREGTRAFLGEEPVSGLFLPEDLRVPHTSGRTALTDDLLRQVAMAFIDETGPGKDRKALQRVAQRFDRPEGTVRGWIARARQEGWLAPGSKGRIGAESGPRLRAWVVKVVADAQDVVKEANSIAMAYGATKARAARDAVRAYEDISERDLSHRMGLPPLETAVVAQVLYGRALSAELAARSSLAGVSEESAFDEIARELRTRMGRD